MARTAAEIAIDVQTSVGSAAADLDRVGASARGMADDVERAAREADNAGDRLGGVADGADTTATKFSTLAGAMGDLAGGLGLIGLGGFSDELEAAAPALMLVAGAADITAVATETLNLATIKQKVSTVASTVASKAQAAATKASAAAQWAWNAAMAANPLGLLLIALVAAAVAFVVLWKRSEKFRAVVKAVAAAARAALGWVIDKLADLAHWIGERVTGAATDLRARWLSVWSAIRDKVGDVTRWMGDKVADARSRIASAVDRIKSVGVSAFKAWLTPIQWVIDKVQWLIDKVNDIHFPSIPDLNPFRTAPGGPTATAPATGTGGTTVNITVQGAVDPYATARQIIYMLRDYGISVGDPA